MSDYFDGPTTIDGVWGGNQSTASGNGDPNAGWGVSYPSSDGSEGDTGSGSYGDGSGGGDVPPGTVNTGTWSTGINWNNILGMGIGVGSQAIQAFGNHPSQQVGGIGVTGIGNGYSPAAVNASLPRPIVTGSGTVAGGVGLDATVNSLAGIIQRNPLLVFGGIAALFLLYRQPPSSARR